MFVPRRIYNEMVKGVVNGVKLHGATLVPLTPFPVSKKTFPFAKMGKSGEDVAVIRNLPHAAFENSLD